MGGKLRRRLTIEPGGGLTHVEHSSSKRKREDVHVPMGVRFVFGSMSAVGATFFTHPIDVVKYTMQVDGKGSKPTHSNSLGAALHLYRHHGFGALYKGLSASMMRQLSYGTTRLGLYTTLMESFKQPDGSPPPFYQKLAFSMTAGGVGAFLGNPFDLALVRMALDSGLPPAERRNYKNVFEAVTRIIRTEGVSALWIGCSPTISRCIVLNMAQLTTYSQAKEELLKTSYFKDNIWCHLASSMISGLVATGVSTPFDVAKTRIQQDKTGEYTGMGQCLVKTARNEGVFALWKGFVPAYLRLAPQTVLVFIFLEQLNDAYINHQLLEYDVKQ